MRTVSHLAVDVNHTGLDLLVDTVVQPTGKVLLTAHELLVEAALHHGAGDQLHTGNWALAVDQIKQPV